MSQQPSFGGLRRATQLGHDRRSCCARAPRSTCAPPLCARKASLGTCWCTSGPIEQGRQAVSASCRRRVVKVGKLGEAPLELRFHTTMPLPDNPALHVEVALADRGAAEVPRHNRCACGAGDVVQKNVFLEPLTRIGIMLTPWDSTKTQSSCSSNRLACESLRE